MPHKVLLLAWPHPESGLLLAGGTEAGSVAFWEAPRPGVGVGPVQTQGDVDRAMEDQRDWTQVAEVKCSKHPIRCVVEYIQWTGLTQSRW